MNDVTLDLMAEDGETVSVVGTTVPAHYPLVGVEAIKRVNVGRFVEDNPDGWVGELIEKGLLTREKLELHRPAGGHTPVVAVTKFTDGGFAVSHIEMFGGLVVFDMDDNGYIDFGGALRSLMQGAKVTRKGWNGKDMWLSLSCKGMQQVPADRFWSPHNKQHALDSGGMANVLPSITMKTASGEIQMGWFPSQPDMLSTDWLILE